MKVEKMSSEEPQKTGLEEKQHSNSILLLKNKDLNRNLSPLHLVAGEMVVNQKENQPKFIVFLLANTIKSWQ